MIHLKEPGSAITHFFGIPMSIIAAFPLITKAAKQQDSVHVLTISIFIICMFLLYLASTIYHSIDGSPAINRILKRLDHCMVFFLIAGSYTPICLIAIGGDTGKMLCIATWGSTLVGCLIKFLWINSPKWFTAVLYVAAGWICLICFSELVHSMPPKAFAWLLTGGIIYTVGAIVYTLKIPLFHNKFKNFGIHELFHLFILAGSFCHIILMYKYICVLPLK